METIGFPAIALICNVNFLPGAPRAVESRIGRAMARVNLVITRNRKILYRTVYCSGFDPQMNACDGGIVERAVIFQNTAIVVISD